MPENCDAFKSRTSERKKLLAKMVTTEGTKIQLKNTQTFLFGFKNLRWFNLTPSQLTANQNAPT